MKGLVVLFIGWWILISPPLLEEPLLLELQKEINVAMALEKELGFLETDLAYKFAVLKERVEREDVSGTKKALEEYFLSEKARNTALKDLAETILSCDSLILYLDLGQEEKDQFRAYWFWRKEMKKSFSAIGQPTGHEEILERAKKLVFQNHPFKTASQQKRGAIFFWVWLIEKFLIL